MNKLEFSEKVVEAEATLYHVAKSILQSDADCADAVQEAIIKAFSKLQSLKDEAYFKTWLCRILINECYKIYRKQKKLVSFEEYAVKVISYEEEPFNDLHDAIEGLNEKMRLPVVLHYVEGFSVNEISKILKIPEGTVKSRLSRGRAELKTTLTRQEAY